MKRISAGRDFQTLVPDHGEVDVRDLLGTEHRRADTRHVGGLPHNEFYKSTWGQIRQDFKCNSIGSGYLFGKISLAQRRGTDPDTTKKQASYARKTGKGPLGYLIFSSSCYATHANSATADRTAREELRNERSRQNLGLPK